MNAKSWFVGMAALALLTAPAAAQTTKLAYVNTQRLVAEAPGASVAQRTLETEMTGLRNQTQALQAELAKLQGDYERQSATLSAAVKKQREDELQRRFTAARDSVQKLEQRAEQRQNQLIQPIMTRVKDAIEAVRKEGSYAIIFDAGNSGMVTADPALDLTERVLTRLRAGGGGAAAAPAAPAGGAPAAR